jgi:hypothetical protein
LATKCIRVVADVQFFIVGNLYNRSSTSNNESALNLTRSVRRNIYVIFGPLRLQISERVRKDLPVPKTSSGRPVIFMRTSLAYIIQNGHELYHFCHLGIHCLMPNLPDLSMDQAVSQWIRRRDMNPVRTIIYTTKKEYQK